MGTSQSVEGGTRPADMVRALRRTFDRTRATHQPDTRESFPRLRCTNPRCTNRGVIMNIHPWKRVIALLAVASYLTTACTTLQNVPLRNADQTVARPAVAVGESVVVTTRSGEKKQFTVTAVEADALVGANDRVAYADMQQLDVRRGEGGKK